MVNVSIIQTIIFGIYVSFRGCIFLRFETFQVMVNWLFGAVGGLDSKGSPKIKGIVMKGVSLESQTTH